MQKNLKNEHAILFLHFVICSFGLLKIGMFAGSSFYYANFLDFAVSKLGTPALLVGVGKLGSFLEYFFGLFFLITFYFLLMLILNLNNFKNSIFLRKKWLLAIYFILNAIFTYRLFKSGMSLVNWLPAWIMFLSILPFSVLPVNRIKIPVLSPKLISLAIGLLFLQIWLIFQPMILKPMQIENDFLDVPEKTKLISGEYVDNTQYINMHKIGGILKYDPRVDNGLSPMPRENTYVKLSEKGLLDFYLNSLREVDRNKYAFFPESNTLSVIGAIKHKYYLLLRHAYKKSEDKQAIDQLYLSALNEQTFYNSRVYSESEWDFIKKNKLELLNQAKTGWFFYHHNYFFAPIFAYAKTGSLNYFPIQYGKFNTLIFAKVLKFIGGVNYQNYFKVLYAIYPLYYFFFLVTLALIFRNKNYVLMGMILGISALYWLSFELIKLAPGFNPLRHFFDIFVFLSFYMYAKKNSLLLLMVTLALCVFSVFADQEFGIFLLSSVCGAVILQEIIERKKITLPLVLSLIFAVTGLLVLFKLNHTKNSNSMYMLLGLGSPTTVGSTIKSLLAVDSIFLLLAVLYRKMKDPIVKLLWCIIFYCQFIFFYILFYPSIHHLLNLAPPLILCLLCMIYLTLRLVQREQSEDKILFVGVMAIFFTAYIPGAIHFYKGQQQIAQNFKTHALFQWSFKNAQFISTMEQQLFINAVNLINQHSEGDFIYLISKYDILLPVLADKINAIPLPELPTNLVTQNDINFVINLIKKNKPQFIFMDTDVKRSLANDIYNSADPLVKTYKLDNYSLDRARVMSYLKLIYFGLQDLYIPYQKSELITAYKLKTS